MGSLLGFLREIALCIFLNMAEICCFFYPISTSPFHGNNALILHWNKGGVESITEYSAHTLNVWQDQQQKDNSVTE